MVEDLTVIAGIGPALRDALEAAGITTFAQLAALGEPGEDRQRADEALRAAGFRGRVDWPKIAAAAAGHMKRSDAAPGGDPVPQTSEAADGPAAEDGPAGDDPPAGTDATADFTALHRVRMNGKVIPRGGTLTCTRPVFETLKRARAIAGDWPEA